jgi:4-coumarate--CoA ligase
VLGHIRDVDLLRVLRGLVVDELTYAGGGAFGSREELALDARAWTEQTPLRAGERDDAGLSVDADSIALLALVERVSALFCLHEAGVEDALLRRPTFGKWIDVVRAAWSMGTRSIAFRTSGTTGESKSVTHPIGRLTTEASWLASEVYGGAERVIADVPAHHIYGFLHTVLAPAAMRAASGTTVEVVDVAGRPPSAAARAIASGDAVVAIPLRLAALNRAMETIGDGAWPEAVRIVTSTGAINRGLIDQLLTCGAGRVIEVFGSTETAGVGVREHRGVATDAAFALLPHVQPTGDAAIRHADAAVIDLPDRLRWTGARSFEVLGRRDAMVQVAGRNVSCAQVASVLRSTPGVADAHVRLGRFGGESRLKAFVVPTDAGALTPGSPAREALLNAIRSATHALHAAERPASLTLGRAIPRGETGKPTDWADWDSDGSCNVCAPETGGSRCDGDD